MKLPSPRALGLPPKYAKWRDDQATAINYVRQFQKRVRGLCAPTGSGKTAVALGLATLALRDNPHARTLILTETKGLQSVYANEGEQMAPGLVADIRGVGNYDCLALEPGGRYDYMVGSRASRGATKCDKAPCAMGLACRLRDVGCTYYGPGGALQHARDASIVVTNYANWLAVADRAEQEEKFGEFDLLICDEGAGAADQVCKSLETELDLRDVQHLKSGRVGIGQPFAAWVRWCRALNPSVELEVRELQAEVKAAKSGGGRVPQTLMRELRRMQRVQRSVQRIGTARGEWVVIRDADRVTFKPVWAEDYCESRLLRGIPDVVIMSATLVPQALVDLGLNPDDFDFLELDSTFPADRRPVYLLPRARMRWDRPEENEKMLAALDDILRCRPDWRGIIHTVSYGRAQLVESRSAERHRMIHHQSTDKESAIDWFFDGSPGDAVIVTPAMSTGYDASDDRCRFQVLVKIPFPDTRDPVVKARVARNKKYLYYTAMQYIVQASGRAVRHVEDYGEMWIVDSNALWFFEAAAEFMPRSFAPSVRKVSGIRRAPKL